VTHLLVTNDFPPKVGGIQSYLWELWRRLPPDDVVVFTTAYDGAVEWDRHQEFRVVRSESPFLGPTPGVLGAVQRLADEIDAGIVLLDPALPLGLIGPRLRRPYGVVLHGAEITVPGRLPGSRQLLGLVLRGARLVVAAGGYPAAEGERAAGAELPTVVVPPGVDTDRFRPLDGEGRAAVRAHHGLPAGGPLVVSVSRLVPRKGMDVLIEAAGRLGGDHPDLTVAIAGSGRDQKRLRDLVDRHQAPVRLLGRVSDEDLPGLYGAGDVFVMLCRNRWAGLEQEGFGIVFVEAGACAVPALAGDSGGAAEAVADGETGLVVRDPSSVDAAERALRSLLDDPELRRSMGEAGRLRAQTEFSYDVLAARLASALEPWS
jgi:phosphatidylinositol alpha-1,6-mannosyltransferase